MIALTTPFAALIAVGDDPAATANIVRRTAACGRPRVAPLSGADWRAFPDGTGGRDDLAGGPAAVRAAAPCWTVDTRMPGLDAVAARRVRRHRREGVR